MSNWLGWARRQMMDRLNDLGRFYALLNSLEEKLGGKRTLAVCNGRMDWPTRGVYFFFEAGEERCVRRQRLMDR